MRKLKMFLFSLLIIMIVISLKLFFVKSKVNEDKDHNMFNNIIENKTEGISKYGYIDILNCINKNNNMQIECINIVENKKCNVDLEYNGDTKVLYNSLLLLSKNENFLTVNSISINKNTNITNISVAFKKNK